MSQDIDLGGNTLIVEDIKVGATAPGQAGTSLSSTELTLLDGVTAGTATASRVLSLNSSKALTWTMSSASTSGSTSVEPLSLTTTMTGVGGVGGRAHFTLSTNVALGGWSNALKGEVTYGASGKTTGLGSAILAEMTLSAGTSEGTYAPLEIELNLGTSASTGTATSLIYASVNGAAAATFDTNGYIFNIAGVTAAAGKVYSTPAGTVDANELTHGLRVKVAGEDYIIPMITVANWDD
jgi:hypothetical protein